MSSSLPGARFPTASASNALALTARWIRRTSAAGSTRPQPAIHASASHRRPTRRRGIAGAWPVTEPRWPWMLSGFTRNQLINSNELWFWTMVLEGELQHILSCKIYSSTSTCNQIKALRSAWGRHAHSVEAHVLDGHKILICHIWISRGVWWDWKVPQSQHTFLNSYALGGFSANCSTGIFTGPEGISTIRAVHFPGPQVDESTQIQHRPTMEVLLLNKGLAMSVQDVYGLSGKWRVSRVRVVMWKWETPKCV